MQRSRLFTLGAIVFALGILLMFPARVAYHLFAPDALKLAAIGGTVWRGSAAEGQADQLYLRNVEWSLRPLALFTGKLAFDTSFDPAGGFVESRVALGIGGRLILQNLEGAVSIGQLRGLLPAPGIDGNARLSFNELILDNGLPVAADGRLDVMGLTVRGFANAPIGDFRTDLATTDEGVSGSVEDLAGMLDVAGAVRIGRDDRSYSLTALIAPTSSTPQSVTNQLKFLGSPNERGQHEFRFEGSMP